MDIKDLMFPKNEWVMCSPQEASDRERFNEISVLECTNLSRNGHPKNRSPDPMRCVKKYRRSAAGGGVIDGLHDERSINDLELTVNYLLGVVFSTQSSVTSQSKVNDVERVSLLQCVLFVDDRLRAVQVDLTTLLGQPTDDICKLLHQIRNIQAKIIRYHLLSQHLLSSFSSKDYEWKFGHKALTTAISSYFATWNQEFSEKEIGNDYIAADIIQLDEIMSYVTLLHAGSIINSREDSIQSYYASASHHQKWSGFLCEDGQGMSAVLGLYRKYCREQFMNTNIQKGGQPRFSKYQFALKIACDVENGNFLSVIRSLSLKRKPEKQQPGSFEEIERWEILSRCCMAQVMPIIRIGLVRLYNRSFMKEEKVKDDDLASLLHLPSPKAATTFCQNIGLPINSNTGNSVVMKAAPICVQGSNDISGREKIRQLINPGRDEDKFVFSSYFDRWLKEGKDQAKDVFEGMSSLQRAMTKAKISKQNANTTISINQEDKNRQNDKEWTLESIDKKETRTDDDGIKILPSYILRKLIYM